MTHFGQARYLQQRALLRFGICTIVLSLAAILCVFLLLGAAPKEAASSSPKTLEVSAVVEATEAVLVPVLRIEEGTQISAAHLSEQQVPSLYLNTGILRASERHMILGSYAKRLLLPNTPIAHVDISPYAPLSKLPIPDGFRAASITVDARSLADGLVRPGARVDVLWQYVSPRGDSKVKTLMPFTKVLAINGETDPGVSIQGASEARATLLVSRDDAAVLELAAQKGTLSLVLYGSTSGLEEPRGSEATIRKLYGETDLPTPKKEGQLFLIDPKTGRQIEYELHNDSWVRKAPE